MKAFGVQQYKQPLSELTISQAARPGKGEVAVKLRAVSINPVDHHIAEGYGAPVMNRRKKFPVVLGRDGCGVVTAVGADIKDISVGQRVAIAVSPLTGGSYAEQVVLPRKSIEPIPDSLSDVEAAAVAYAGSTVLQAIHAAGVNAGNARGRRVCINGASGGLGACAIQLLNHWGAEVVAVCSEANHEWVKSLGAHELIDYRNADAMAAIKANAIINAAPPSEMTLKAVIRDPLARGLIKDGGEPGYSTVVTPMIGMITVLGALPGVAMGISDYLRRKVWFRTVKGSGYRWVIFRENPDVLREVVEFFGSSQAKPVCRKGYSLSELTTVFNDDSAGKVPGKTVFTWE